VVPCSAESSFTRTVNTYSNGEDGGGFCALQETGTALCAMAWRLPGAKQTPSRRRSRYLRPVGDGSPQTLTLWQLFLLCRGVTTECALSQSRDLQLGLHRRYKVFEPVRCEVADLVVPEVALVKSIPPRVASAGRPRRFRSKKRQRLGPRGG
jgi:hypothetical protein